MIIGTSGMTRAREKFCKKAGTGGWKMEGRDDRRYSGKMEERKEWQLENSKYDREYVRRRQGKVPLNK